MVLIFSKSRNISFSLLKTVRCSFVFDRISQLQVYTEHDVSKYVSQILTALQVTKNSNRFIFVH